MSGPAPESFEALQEQLAPSLRGILDTPFALLVIAAIVGTALYVTIAIIAQRIRATHGSRSGGASWLGAALGCAALYALGRVLDPMLVGLLQRPEWFPPDLWAEVGWFEWKVFGRPWAVAALPLSRHPELALVVHGVLWTVVMTMLRGALVWLYDLDRLTWTSPESQVPWFFRWVGSSTPRRADHRFRHWIGRVLPAAIALHAMAGLRMSSGAEPFPTPGVWVISGIVIWALTYHLGAEGRQPEGEKAKVEDDEELEPGEEEPTVLMRLGRAVEARRPGVHLAELEERPGAPGERQALPAGLAPLVAEVFVELEGGVQPWAHQVEVLDHLIGLWSMRAGPAPTDSPTLAEELGASPIQRADLSTPHALLLAPEGSGRTTTTLLAALHVFLDRGATTLVLVRRRAEARAWASRLHDALASSSARWNVRVCVAGEDLAPELAARRLPAVVVADLEAFEAEVLADDRTDAFLSRLGLCVADDLDHVAGVAEMHLQMGMRRLWTLLDRLHAAAYPVVVLGTAAQGASGIASWAKHVLAVPLRTFEEDRAATRHRVLLRRRDLVDAAGDAVPIRVLAEACDEAELKWHLRVAGDARRGVKRADFDLGALRRHHVDDPRHAEVVIVEGTYPDVHREATRLAHAGVDAPGIGAAVVVLAPPADEEMVLHEEAIDAPCRELIESFPRAVTLGEPHVVRQRHFDRALGREQDLDALRDRFGGAFVDQTVAQLERDGLVVRRTLHAIDPETGEVRPHDRIRALRGAAIGEAIQAECVTEAETVAAIVDASTSEQLGAVDLASARVRYPGAHVFLHPRGRFAVREQTGERGEILADALVATQRSTADRSLELVSPAPEEFAWTERRLGGRPLNVALAHARVRESVVGVRRFAPGPELVDHRIFPEPQVCEYGTEACFVELDVPGAEGAPVADITTPLAAAVRMMLPCTIRAADDLVDVEVVRFDERAFLCFFDRSPGGSGLARFVWREGLKDLLRSARLVLERLVGPELARLRHIHDRTPGSQRAKWRIAEALSWMDAVLDAPREDQPSETAIRGSRVEFTPGEGEGDLGRLWISRSGRSDDLVWTRHAWRSTFPIGSVAAGEVFFDVALERPAIAASRRRAFSQGGDASRERKTILQGAHAIHRAILAADRADLAPVRACLGRLAGARAADVVLDLVAAMPLDPRPLSAADRGPLAALARRRVDPDAKLLLACALLPDEAQAEIVGEGIDRAWVRVRTSEGTKTVDLNGPSALVVEEARSRRATRIFGA